MKRILCLVLWMLSAVAAIVCLICDYAISTHLDWSLVVLLSILLFVALFTVVLKTNHPLRNSLLSITLLILPFLFILSMLLQEKLIFSLGGTIAVICCLFLWIMYSVYIKYKRNLYRVISITFLLSIPLVFSILYSCTHFFGSYTIEWGWSIFNSLLMLLLAFGFLAIDLTKSKTA